MSSRQKQRGVQAFHEGCRQTAVPLTPATNRSGGRADVAITRRKSRKKKRVPRTLRAGDLLRPETLEDLLARQAEERRLAEEAEDRAIKEWDDEICAHPIGHPGHVPHGCT